MEEAPQMTSTRTALMALAIAAAAGAPIQATAQARSEVHFTPGSDSATVQGSITGQEYADYLLGARAGQTMAVSLEVTATDGDGTAYFNILPPGSADVAIFNGSMSADGNGEVSLPEDGEYTIRVYLMGDDEDAGKTVSCAVTASIR
jgi:hypothetical protein